MKYQILFSGKNKKNIINLSSAEFAEREVKWPLRLYPLSANYGRAKQMSYRLCEKRRHIFLSVRAIC